MLTLAAQHFAGLMEGIVAQIRLDDVTEVCALIDTCEDELDDANAPCSLYQAELKMFIASQITFHGASRKVGRVSWICLVFHVGASTEPL